MTIRIKPGVEFAVVAPAGYLILEALKAASRKLGQDLTITSGTDGKHSGPTDPHKRGVGYDCRSHDFPDALRPVVLRAIMTELQMDPADLPVATSGGLATTRFFGFLEAAGTENEHFHCQLRRAATFTVEDLLAFDPAIPAPAT